MKKILQLLLLFSILSCSSSGQNIIRGGNYQYTGSAYFMGPNVGVNTLTPTAKFQVNGTLKFVTGGQSAGRVLTSDAAGNATWQNLNAWGLTGNAGTNSSTNFIGTTDNQRLTISTNGKLKYSIGNLANTVISYQDSFFALYRNTHMKTQADGIGFLAGSMFSWFDSSAANNVA